MQPVAHLRHRPDTSSTAAQYVRMSTDLQRDSPANQKEALAQYAARNGLRIARMYEDYGKSGSSMRNPPALARLLHDALEENRILSILLAMTYPVGVASRMSTKARTISTYAGAPGFGWSTRSRLRTTIALRRTS
jgi:hypothetical protein